MTTYKNIFKCICGNHQFFTGLKMKIDKNTTWDTSCNYCLKRQTMKFVRSVELTA